MNLPRSSRKRHRCGRIGAAVSGRTRSEAAKAALGPGPVPGGAGGRGAVGSEMTGLSETGADA
jgi:hypothetical protein